LPEIAQICAIECINKNISMKYGQIPVFTFLLLPWLVTFRAKFKSIKLEIITIIRLIPSIGLKKKNQLKYKT